MLQLTLIRHAKSSWSDPELSDFERPLNKRGRKNAPLMGKIMKQRGMTFDLLVSSPAERAISTACLIAAKLKYPAKKIRQVEELYAASAGSLLQCVQQFNPKDKRVALVAHNPGLTDFCNYLTGEDISNLPTCAVALIEFELDDWQAVDRDSGRLLIYEYPRKYTG